MKIRLKLKTKIFIFFSTIIAIMGGVVLYSLNYYIKEEVYDVKKQDLRIVTEGFSEELEQIFLFSRDVAQKISRQKEVREFLAEQDGAQEKVKNLMLNSIIPERNTEIFILGKDGNVITSTSKNQLRDNYSQMNYYKDAWEKGSGLSMAFSKTDNKPGYYFSQVVKNSSDEKTGVVVVRMEYNIVKNIFSRYSQKDFEIMIIDNFGVVVYSNDKNNEYKSLQFLTPKEQEEAGNNIRFSNIETKFLNRSNLNSWLKEGREGVFLAEEGGEKLISSINSIGNFDYYVNLNIAIEKVEKNVNRISFWLSAFFLLFILLVVLVFGLFLNRIMKPLESLMDAIDKISKGDLNRRVNIETKDEIGKLGEEFNSVLDKLEKSKKEVENKIVKKTEDLEKLNRYMSKREMKMIELKKKIKQLKERIKEE